jgi:hypothetical protein
MAPTIRKHESIFIMKSKKLICIQTDPFDLQHDLGSGKWLIIRSHLRDRSEIGLFASARQSYKANALNPVEKRI